VRDIPYTITKCKHIFYKECLDGWFLIKKNCRKLLFVNNRLVAQVTSTNEISIILSETKVNLKISLLKYSLHDLRATTIEYPELDAYHVVKCNTDVAIFDKHSRAYRVFESVLPNQYTNNYWIHIEPLSEQLTKFIIIREFDNRPGLYFISYVFERIWSHEVRVETAENISS
jgi:PIN domain nuclease of toxin-antitoxin system